MRLIAALGDEESVPLLLDLLHGRTTALRIPLLDAIGRIGGPVARLALREVAGGPAGEDRFVYRALAACAEPEDLPLFRAARKHPDGHVRMVCVDALGAMARPEDRVRIAAASADRAPAVAACARKWLTP